MRPIYFNGKFYGGGLNGVHRVADRLIRECDMQLAEKSPAERPEVVLLAPAASTWLPDLQTIRVKRIKGALGQAWEQLSLPKIAADGVLVNLANLAPVMHRRKVTMIHDAQFLFPDSGYPLRQKVGYKLLTPLMARSSEHVVTVSDYSRQMLSLMGVAELERITVIHNGANHILETPVDDSLKEKLGLGVNNYAVMFGSPKPYKNNGIVFEAFTNIDDDSFKLVIVGTTRKQLSAAGLSVPPSAIFAGRIDDGQLRGLLASATALLYPSRTEGFGLPPLEAMLCGCPVVVSPAGAIPEACGDAALYCGVDDPASWRQAMQELRENKALRTYKIDNGLNRARMFTWRSSGARLIELLERMAIND